MKPSWGAVRLGMGGLGITTYLEYLFVDNGTAYTVNVDGTMPIIPLGIASLYGGIGAGLLVTDSDFTDSNTETVGDLILGAGFNATRLKPFGQVKYVFVDGDDPFGLLGGNPLLVGRRGQQGGPGASRAPRCSRAAGTSKRLRSRGGPAPAQEEAERHPSRLTRPA